MDMCIIYTHYIIYTIYIAIEILFSVFSLKIWHNHSKIHFKKKSLSFMTMQIYQAVSVRIADFLSVQLLAVTTLSIVFNAI